MPYSLHPFKTFARCAISTSLTGLIPAAVLTMATPAFAEFIPGIGMVRIPESNHTSPADAGMKAHTNLRIYTPADAGGQQLVVSPNVSRMTAGLPPYLGYYYETPASLACVYHLVSNVIAGCNPNSTTVTATGGSKAIAIVDAYDYPSARNDLAAFSKQFNLPVPTTATFAVAYGSGSKPSTDPSGGWEVEEALDIEWAHAMAPNAKIILVEAKSASFTDLKAALKVAIQQVQAAGGGEVSMSWGSGEWSSEASYDSWFTGNNVVFIASSGDSPGTSWPSVSPNVISAGGTSTMRNPSTGAFVGNAAWQAGGGGKSSYEKIPAYQSAVASVKAIAGTQRAVPDVAFDADPNTGVWVAYAGYWYIVGGTSLSSPALAGVINRAGVFRASTAAELNNIYNNMGRFSDVTQGVCGPYAGYVAGAGYDLCTGAGVPNGEPSGF